MNSAEGFALQCYSFTSGITTKNDILVGVVSEKDEWKEQLSLQMRNLHGMVLFLV